MVRLEIIEPDNIDFLLKRSLFFCLAFQNHLGWVIFLVIIFDEIEWQINKCKTNCGISKLEYTANVYGLKKNRTNDKKTQKH